MTGDLRGLKQRQFPGTGIIAAIQNAKNVKLGIIDGCLRSVSIQ